MVARRSKAAALDGLSPASSVTRAPRRIDALGSAALVIAVVGLILIVYMLHPDAAPSDSGHPREVPLSAQIPTHDDWARAMPLSLDVCETRSDLVAADTLVFSSEGQAREEYARPCTSAVLSNVNPDSLTPTTIATCDMHGALLDTTAPRESASPDWVYVADLDECIPARW
jgi:hypothetical protein